MVTNDSCGVWGQHVILGDFVVRCCLLVYLVLVGRQPELVGRYMISG